MLLLISTKKSKPESIKFIDMKVYIFHNLMVGMVGYKINLRLFLYNLISDCCNLRNIFGDVHTKNIYIKND